MNYIPKHFKLPSDQTVYIKGSSPYIFSEQIAIAVDVALATGRPLLVAGPPGCGKSRLAHAVAALKEWSFIAHTMTSRTRLEELTSELDHLQRLHDAQIGTDSEKIKKEWLYLKPGIFWWAYDSESAKRRGGDIKEAEEYNAILRYPASAVERAKHVVVLLDEIDKAEPDLPNDLLEPLDGKSFRLPNGSEIQSADNLQVLTVITTNRERELPAAFLRRCVTLTIEEPDTSKLILIGEKHFPDAEAKLLKLLASKVTELGLAAERTNIRAPGTSEFLDAVLACRELKLKVNTSEWDRVWPKIEQAILIKDVRAR